MKHTINRGDVFYANLKSDGTSRQSDKVSSEYFEGSFPLVYCNIQGTICTFKNNYKDCELWVKKRNNFVKI